MRAIPPEIEMPETTVARSTASYFRWAFAVTVFGLALGAWLGWRTTGTLGGAATLFFICAVLAVLEISLSFDNAIVNANKLKTMTPLWRRRFLTWGIVVAVFGMRVIFPLAIVAVAAHIGPIEALRLAATRPEDYARIMTDAHLPIAAFGGTFLMMVGLTYFFDQEKDVHWIVGLERNMARFATVEGIEIAVVLGFLLGFSELLDATAQPVFLRAGLYGLLTFLAVEVIGGLIDATQRTLGEAAKGGLGAFLYLEVLDASFSFDGVIGAFAITADPIIIALGLGFIGAMFVRSLTVYLVRKGTLSEYVYLEHGAHWAIGALALILFYSIGTHVPEIVTGLVGVVLIAASFISSIIRRRNEPEDAKDHIEI
jgi:hypothetical protein